MKIPSDFGDALRKAYERQSDLNRLFVEQKEFIMRLVRHSMRHHHWGVYSDEDDIYQEACIWLLDSMWEWDETRGPTLEEYVVYNIGVRLQNYLQKETAQKRTPPAPSKSIINYRYYDGHDEDDKIYESDIDSEVPTPEDLLIVQRACDRVDRELPLLARELLDALLLEEGNMSGASRRIYDSGRLRIVREMSHDAFRLLVSRNILPELRSIFSSEHIIPV